MKQPGQPEIGNERHWRARFGALRQQPPPNLEYGRARVLAAAQKRFAPSQRPHRGSLALAFGVALGVILLMGAMNSGMGALPITRVALTRTETLPNRSDATGIAPSAHPESPGAAGGFVRSTTPAPGAVPEPPRSPAVFSTLSWTLD